MCAAAVAAAVCVRERETGRTKEKTAHTKLCSAKKGCGNGACAAGVSGGRCVRFARVFVHACRVLR